MDYNIFHLFFRHGITFKEVSGESEKVTREMTAPWEETNLPTILARYHLKDIFNADEFGLFYKTLPSKSFHFQIKRFSGGKHSKVRLTGMAASNALDEKIPMFVIGKSASPRYFKHVPNLPCRYGSQKKVWMDGTLFEEWLRELDRTFEMQGRKVVMIVDNCPAHPKVSGLKANNLQFLPSNTTYRTQPMDQGIIRYRISSNKRQASHECYPLISTDFLGIHTEISNSV